MRLVYKKYSDGTYKVYETDASGRNETVLDTDVPNDRKAGTVSRVPVFIELSCDENDNSKQDAKTGLDLLLENLKKLTK